MSALLLRAVKLVFKITFWCLAALWLFAILAIMQKDFRAGAKCLAYTCMVAGVTRQFWTARRRRVELAREAAAAPAPPPEHPYRPSMTDCIHFTRGAGKLVVDNQGNLHFVADSTGARKDISYCGLDECDSTKRFIVRRFKAIFGRGIAKKLYAEDRDLIIKREQLRFVLTRASFSLGPTVVVAYRQPESERLRFEEFSLSAQTAKGVRIPTADAEGWARDLGLPAPPADSRRDIECRRNRIRRRMALADLSVGWVATGAIMLSIGGLLGGLIALDSPLAGGIVAGMMIAVWGLTISVCTVAQLRGIR